MGGDIGASIKALWGKHPRSPYPVSPISQDGFWLPEFRISGIEFRDTPVWSIGDVSEAGPEPVVS